VASWTGIEQSRWRSERQNATGLLVAVGGRGARVVYLELLNHVPCVDAEQSGGFIDSLNRATAPTGSYCATRLSRQRLTRGDGRAGP
jgi:hypothetical protein